MDDYTTVSPTFPGGCYIVAVATLAAPLALTLLKRMLLIRRFEERLILLSQEGHAFGHFHVYAGQETTGVAALSVLDRADVVFSTHRNHGHLLARGADPGRMFAEILGRSGGYNGGRGGTLHVSSKELGFPVCSAIVGGVLPLATGAGLTSKQLSRGTVSVACFGDGAMEEGAFFESINIASLWKLPVIYLCENNSQEALGQKAGEYPSSTIAARELVDVVRPFQLPAAAVDGANVAVVRAAMVEAVERARAGAGPSFIEARTVRWPGSRPLWPSLDVGRTDLAMASEESRIPSGKYSAWHRRQDGLLAFVRELLSAKTASIDQVLSMDAELAEQIERAVEFALESPLPEVEGAAAGVFA